MPRNDGMTSEAIFDAHFSKLGKKAFLYSFIDTRKLRGAGGSGFANARPSDRLVTENGETFYAEIKSTEKDRFAFSLIRPPQWAAAKRQVTAGGRYYFFVHHLPTNRWYQIPAWAVVDSDKKSMSFSEIEGWRWEPKL